MIHLQRTKLIALIFCVVILIPLGIILINLAGCAQTQIRVGWIGSQTSNRITYEYSKFNGSETADILAEIGQDLIISYDVKITSGSINLRVVNPEGIAVWEKSLWNNEQRVDTLPLDLTGHYTIVIEGIDTSGNFDLHWEKK
jgi:hypothetical protein